MSEMNIPAVGIDLGTTYSVVARIDERGQPVTLVNAEGDRLTPSVVLLDGDDVVVGKEAMKAMGTEADRVAECSKREMGHRLYHRQINGKQYPPEVIQAWILNKLRSDAVQQIGPFDKAVITVPAYFDEVRRKATQDAGYMAGWKCWTSSTSRRRRRWPSASNRVFSMPPAAPTGRSGCWSTTSAAARSTSP